MITIVYHFIQVQSGVTFPTYIHSLLNASEGGGSTKDFPPASFLLLLVLF
jgi:hypothetical protein